MAQGRMAFSMCNYRDSFIFISGQGMPEGYFDKADSSVERFNLASEQWEYMPDMLEARYSHASCALANAVYVFCGVGKFDEELQSIERLRAPDAPASAMQPWDSIEIADEASRLTPIFNCYACTIEEQGNRIVVFGGGSLCHEFNLL